MPYLSFLPKNNETDTKGDPRDTPNRPFYGYYPLKTGVKLMQIIGNPLFIKVRF